MNDMKEELTPFSRERFDYLKELYEAHGYKVLSKWRPGIKHIRLDAIVLGERPGTLSVEEEETHEGAGARAFAASHRG